MATQAQLRVWINQTGKDIPDWVQSGMSDGKIGSNGSFFVESHDGPTLALQGWTVFEHDGYLYATDRAGAVTGLVEKLKAGENIRTGKVPVLNGQTKAPAVQQPPRQAGNGQDPHSVPAPASPSKARRPYMANGIMPNLQWTPLDRLQVDDTYQRSIEGAASQKMIEKIAMEWDWRLCIPLLVVQRQTGLFVIDGQHRLEGARLRAELGAMDVTQLPCAIFAFDSVTEEANLFVQSNKSRRPMGRLDVFHAQLAAGDPKATALNDLVTAAGLVIGRNEQWQMLQPGEVVFTTAIAKGIRLVGEERAGQLLKMMAAAFEGEPLNAGSAIFAGLVDLYQKASDKKPIDDEVVASMLAARTMKEWREAVAAADGGFGRAEAMIALIREDYAVLVGN